MDLGIAGRRALVAGSSSGIGAAIARELAREGDALVLSLPLLTAAEPLPSPVDAPDRAAG